MDYTYNDPLAGRSAGFRDFIAAEAAEQAARIKQVADQASAPLRQANAAMTKLMVPTWSKPVPELKAMFRKAQGNKTVLTTWYWNVLLRPNAEMIPQDQTEAAQTFDEFVEKTLPSQGWRLSVAGCTRLWAFCYVQREAGGNAITPENLKLWFDALQENGCFDAKTGELSYAEPVRAPEPPRVPTLDDLDRADTSTNEGRAETHRLLARLWAGEVQTVLIQWLDDMLKRFAFNPTEQQMGEIKQFIESRNLDPRNSAHLSRIRVAFTRAGKFPERCLLDQELRSILLDKIDTGDRETTRLLRGAPIDVVRDWMKRNNVTIY